MSAWKWYGVAWPLQASPRDVGAEDPHVTDRFIRQVAMSIPPRQMPTVVLLQGLGLGISTIGASKIEWKAYTAKDLTREH